MGVLGLQILKRARDGERREKSRRGSLLLFCLVVVVVFAFSFSCSLLFVAPSPLSDA